MKNVFLVLAFGLGLSMGGSNAMARGYFNIAAGSTTPEEDEFDKGNGFKFGGGIELNDNFAFEVNYTNLGEFDADSATLAALSGLIGETVTAASVEVGGFEIGGKAMAPIGDMLSVFGRFGMYFWDTDVNVSVSGFGTGTESESGTDTFVGLGGAYHINEAASLYVEYSMYEANDAEVDYLGLGLSYLF